MTQFLDVSWVLCFFWFVLARFSCADRESSNTAVTVKLLGHRGAGATKLLFKAAA